LPKSQDYIEVSSPIRIDALYHTKDKFRKALEQVISNQWKQKKKKIERKKIDIKKKEERDRKNIEESR